jgi:hypothetical protein
MKVKVIVGTNSSDFENEVNEWLKEFKGLLFASHYNTVAKEDGSIFFSVMIVY